MRTVAVLVIVLSLLVSAWAIAALSVNIQVSPATIILKAPLQWITIHTDIPYSSVDPDSVEINGYAADAVFSDNCGDLVAKLDFDTIADDLVAPSVEIVLKGETDGEAFSGSEVVRVK